MKRRLAIVLGIMCVVSVASCGGAPEAPAAPAGPSNDDLVAIRKMDTDFREAVLRSDWPAIGRFFADKAVLMPPNAKLVAGAAAIVEWYASAGMTIQEFTTTVEAIGGSGNLAVNRGAYRIVFTPAGAPGPIAEFGKYLWVLQRQQDQSWRVTAATWNADAPAQPKQ